MGLTAGLGKAMSFCVVGCCDRDGFRVCRVDASRYWIAAWHR